MNGAFQGFEITELTNHNHNVDHLVSSRLTGKPQNKHALGHAEQHNLHTGGLLNAFMHPSICAFLTDGQAHNIHYNKK